MIEPEQSAAFSPAIWASGDTPSVVVFEYNSLVSGTNRSPDLVNFDILKEAKTHTGTHFVLQNIHGRHRLLLRGNNASIQAAYVIAADAWFEARSSATLALHRATQTCSTRASRPPLAPSQYQRHRLSLMLDILDFMQVCGANRATIRHIAQEIVYPNHLLPRAIEWKSSTQRRATFRLVNQALQMRATGYRTLLTGRLST